LNIRFYKNDKSLIGRPHVESFNLLLDRKETFIIIEQTFEDQVKEMKTESTEILEL